MTPFLLAMALCLQDPVPGPAPSPAVDVVIIVNDEDNKAFVNAAIKAVDASDLRRLQKFIIKRRLKSPRFVELVKSEYVAEKYWENPESFDAQAIDWSNIDWAKLIDLILTLIKIFG